MMVAFRLAIAHRSVHLINILGRGLGTQPGSLSPAHSRLKSSTSSFGIRLVSIAWNGRDFFPIPLQGHSRRVVRVARSALGSTSGRYRATKRKLSAM